MDLSDESKRKESRQLIIKSDKNNDNNSFTAVNHGAQGVSTKYGICDNDAIYYSVASTTVNDSYLTTTVKLGLFDDNINSLLRQRPQSAHSYERQELRPIRELQKRKLSQDINYCRYNSEREAREQRKKYSRWLQV